MMRTSISKVGQIDSRKRPGKPELLKITDRIYCGHHYSVSNVFFIITDDSVIVIDAAESRLEAQACLNDFRQICDLPITHLIYTHFHGDHIRGAKVFQTTGTKVIAQQQLPAELAKKDLLRFHSQHANAIQISAAVPNRPTVTAVRAAARNVEWYVPPDITFDDEYTFEQGNVRCELYHTQGETVDHLMVWIPSERALFPGDLFYDSFPMLSNPMKPDRPVLAWAESIGRMRRLGAEYLLPSHSRPLQGKERVELALGNYEKAIRYVHDETVRFMNLGLTLNEIRRRVRLPRELLELSYLQERYGTVDWSVVGIFRQYTGWYDFRPVNLRPSTSSEFSSAVLRVTGGAAPILAGARTALREGKPQVALELTDLVLAARPKNTTARETQTAALRQLAETATNAMERNIYRAAIGLFPEGQHSNSGATPARPPEVDGPQRSPVGKQIPANGRPVGPPFARSTTIPAPSQAVEPSHMPLPEGDLIQSINAWYDYAMFDPSVLSTHDFTNYGYWAPGTHSCKKACEDLMERLLAFIPDKDGKILDVACGKGATTKYMLKYYLPSDISAINISAKQLERARVNAPGCQFSVMSAVNLTFPDNTFDNIICVEAAFHFNTRRMFLEEALRVLKPGGRLVLSDILHTTAARAGPLMPGPNFVSNPDDYAELYRQMGFEDVNVIDATHECWTQFYEHAMLAWRRVFMRKQIRWAGFGRRILDLMSKRDRIKHYLLVAAKKPSPEQIVVSSEPIRF